MAEPKKTKKIDKPAKAIKPMKSIKIVAELKAAKPAKKLKAPKPPKAPKPSDADVARRIWLAGVGAYGQAYTGVQSAAGKLADQAGAAFEDLVAKGEALEAEMRAGLANSPKGKKVAALITDVAKSGKAFREEQKAALESRVSAVRKTLSETLAPYNPAALAHTVEALSARVDELGLEVAALKAGKAAPAEVETSGG